MDFFFFFLSLFLLSFTWLPCFFSSLTWWAPLCSDLWSSLLLIRLLIASRAFSFLLFLTVWLMSTSRTVATLYVLMITWNSLNWKKLLFGIILPYLLNGSTVPAWFYQLLHNTPHELHPWHPRSWPHHPDHWTPGSSCPVIGQLLVILKSDWSIFSYSEFWLVNHKWY